MKMKAEQLRRFNYQRPSELDGKEGQQWPVAIVGAGPVGLCAAIDLALHGVKVTLLDEDDTVSPGSRAFCWAKRTLEILDRIGVADRVLQKGVTWNIGKVFHRDELLYSFNLLPELGHKMPAFVNLQQSYLEEYLVERAVELGIDLRWRNRVIGARQDGAGVTLRVETPDGAYDLCSNYVLAADGAHSSIRRMLGLSFEGKVYEDRFLIADVHMKADFPTERWFWFHPPFHSGQSALLHRQADDVWRVDLQLGVDADPEEERKPERVIPRLKAMLGEDTPFELEWVSIYAFQCRRLKRFRHNRIIFVGDSAHQVSPFGARGGNGGIQDADNLVWKVALVLKAKASEDLLDSYDEERGLAADENILNSRRSTDFMTPKGYGSQTLRDAVLQLAHRFDFAQKMVNSGRLSRPTPLCGCALQTPDVEIFKGELVPGAPCVDAPVQLPTGEDSWLLSQLGCDFCVLVFADEDRTELPEIARTVQKAQTLGISLQPVVVCNSINATINKLDGLRIISDPQGMACSRYDAQPGTAYLIRPDQHIAARWRQLQATSLMAALSRTIGTKQITPTHAGG